MDRLDNNSSENQAGHRQIRNGVVSGSSKAMKRCAAVLSVAAVVAGGVSLSAPTASAGEVCGYFIGGAIERKWIDKGGLGGPLGCPTSDELTNPDGDGKRSHFGDRGIIYWRNYTGAHPVWGMILQTWGNNGYERSKWRYPKTDEWEQSSNGFRSYIQDFECGRIAITSGVPGATYICD
ncbi:hypothetical protein [Nocardia ninae]|uniref:Uncharacterized protein n=1 Tax=Nocardia ninae NBRC 108245 TaxID=1210091 RepID=A0A511MQD0_9NOCA|nr:hypothetical protein [Nocardia ninae]GEM42196.1 hypothetical protein NN4_67150 [Nocardia ninae NBRC 108245]